MKRKKEMNKLFSPETHEEKMMSAAIDLIMDMQFSIQAAMKERGISQKDLAKLVGCTPSNISQMLADGANPEVGTIAKALAAMKENFLFATATLNGDLFKKDYRSELKTIEPAFLQVDEYRNFGHLETKTTYGKLKINDSYHPHTTRLTKRENISEAHYNWIPERVFFDINFEEESEAA